MFAFHATLPWPLEFLLSLPGNLMGPPLIQVAGPLWLLIIMMSSSSSSMSRSSDAEGQPEVAIPGLLLWLAVSLSTLLLGFWLLVLRGDTFIFNHVLFGHVSFSICPSLGTILCYYLAPSPEAFAIAIHSIVLYCACCGIILFLKQGTLRKRPCCNHPRCIQRKNLAIVPRILARSAPDASFPSGDVMSATALALPLAHIGHPHWAVMLVALTAFGRMFFLAHHLLDTVVGMGVCILMHCALTVSFGLSIGNADWYHPLVAFGSLVIASLFRKSDQK